jgi:hypothetical protein
VLCDLQVAVDEDFVPGSRTILNEYSGSKVVHPALGDKPDRSELRDPNDPVRTDERKVDISHKPSRSEAE